MQALQDVAGYLLSGTIFAPWDSRAMMTKMSIAACLWAACAVQAADSPQQHWVRGTVMRVSESFNSTGGLEWDNVGSAAPRVSGDGNKVVFYSDATFSEGFEQANDYHIWM